MRVLLQRVREASVSVAGEEISRIGAGLLVFVGVYPDDSEAMADRLAEKTVRLRIFPGLEGKAMDRSLAEVGGQLLVVSQFTLAAETRKGLRPGFSRAAPPPVAEPLYEYFADALERALSRPVSRGRFGADMQVALINDGPVTLLLES